MVQDKVEDPYRVVRLVTCVISDNPEHPVTELLRNPDTMAARISDLISAQVDTISQIIESLLSAQHSLPDTSELDSLLQYCRLQFTVSRTNETRLQRALRQYRARFGEYPTAQELSRHHTCTSAIESLTSVQSSTAVRY